MSLQQLHDQMEKAHTALNEFVCTAGTHEDWATCPICQADVDRLANAFEKAKAAYTAALETAVALLAAPAPKPWKPDVKLYHWRNFATDRRGPYVRLPAKYGKWYFKQGMGCHAVFDNAGPRPFKYCTAISDTAAFYLRFSEDGTMIQFALVTG